MSCRIIGITGGIGAGKSTVLTYLYMNYKCMVLITDMIAYEIIRNDESCLSEIKEIFKEDDICSSSGIIDSVKVGKIIFKDNEKRKKMNASVHPRVINFVKKECENAKEENKIDFVLIESALLIECGLAGYCDDIIYVTAPEEERIKRLMNGRKERGYTREKCRRIIAGQLPDSEFLKYASAVIDTSHTRKESYQNADKAMEKLGFKKKQKGYGSSDIIDAIAANIDD